MKLSRLGLLAGLSMLVACSPALGPADTGVADSGSTDSGSVVDSGNTRDDGTPSDVPITQDTGDQDVASDLDVPLVDVPVGIDVPLPPMDIVIVPIDARPFDVPRLDIVIPPFDVPVIDTGNDRCTGPGQCAGGYVCSLTTCGSTGSCVVAGRCGTVVAPVCGCDGVTYTNDCYRVLASVGKASDGPCADAGTSTDGGRCVAPSGCCVSDTDCGRGYCVAPGPTCTTGGTNVGVCKTLPTAGCWRNADCRMGQTCVGARICPCGAACLLPDQPGSCN